MDLMPSDLTAVKSTLPAYAMIANQQNFTRLDEWSTSQPSSRTAKAKSGKFVLLSRAIMHLHIHLEVLSLQNHKYFEYFFCFHQTLGTSPKDLEGFKANITFIYKALACSLARWQFPQLTFVTRNFIGSSVIRWGFLLVSKKDDCLDRVLRKSFWVKKLINKIFLHLLNKFWEIFYKSNRKHFSCVCIACYKH